MLSSELCDAAVDRASDGVAASSQIEVDAGCVAPGVGSRLQVVLMIEVFGKHAPFLFVARSLEKLELVEAGEYGVIVSRHALQGVPAPGRPGRGTDPPRPRCQPDSCRVRRMALWSKSSRSRILPASSVRSRLRYRRTSSLKAMWTSSRFVRTPVSRNASCMRIVVQHNVGSHVSRRFPGLVYWNVYCTQTSAGSCDGRASWETQWYENSRLLELESAMRIGPETSSGQPHRRYRSW